MEYSLNIVLIEPEIPQNTGNIARTCAATGARLHLVGPMGFHITDRQVKRAGLDYWDKLDITFYDSTAEFLKRTRAARFTTLPPKQSKTTATLSTPTAATSFSERKRRACPRSCLRRITTPACACRCAELSAALTFQTQLQSALTKFCANGTTPPFCKKVNSTTSSGNRCHWGQSPMTRKNCLIIGLFYVII